MTSGIGRRRIAAKSDGGLAYQERRREIAEAAARVFDRHGFRGTTISSVANELNIDRASVYYYIANKEELFDEVIREASEENIATARRIQQSDERPPEKLRQLARELMKSYSHHYPLLYIFIRENLNQVADRRSAWAEQMKQLSRDYEQSVIAVIEEGYADGSFRELGPAKIVAYGIIGMLGWTNRWYRPGQADLDAESIGEIYATIATRGLMRVGKRRSKPASAKAERRARKNSD